MPVLDEILSQPVRHRLLAKTGPHSNHALCKGVLPCLRMLCRMLPKTDTALGAGLCTTI